MAADDQVTVLPAGTLTCLVTDVEGGLIESVVNAHGGTLPAEPDAHRDTTAVFASAVNAVTAALEVQQCVSTMGLRPCIAVHTGRALSLIHI